MQLTTSLLLNCIHGVHIHRCIITVALRGSHAAFPLRWTNRTIWCRILLSESFKFIKLMAMLLQNGFKPREPLWILLFLPLCFSRSAFVRVKVFGKPDNPWTRRSEPSRSSSLFRIPESLCQLIVLSVGNKLPSSTSFITLISSFLGEETSSAATISPVSGSNEPHARVPNFLTS